MFTRSSKALEREMANAGFVDSVAASDPNRRVDASSDFTVSATVDHPSFFDDLGFDDEDGNFEFNLDDLSLPSDTEPFVVGDFDFIDEAKEMCLVNGDRIDFGIGTVMDSNSTVSVDGVDFNVCDNSGNEIVDFDEFKNVVDVCVGGEDLVQCEGLYGKGLSNDESPSCDGNEPVSSHGSGTCGVSFEGVNYSSPEPVSNCDKNVWCGGIGDCEMVNEKDVLGTRSLSKMIKESGEGKIEKRSNKRRRAGERNEKCVSSGNEDDEKRKARMMRNRESAQLSRQRKKQYVDELEEKIRMMHSTIADLNHRISFVMAENTCLRQQLGGGAMYPPPPGMYAHMPYPWVPYPHAVQPPGSQVPLVPIPRLKPRQPSKSKSSTKKVASISLLGLLVFIFLFGALVPLMNLRYDGTAPHIHNPYKDRILTTNSHRDGSEFMIAPASLSVRGNNPHNERSRVDERKNSSEPLSVSLYVPRNDQLLKIDGNLIIHSFLASEKSMSVYMTTENVNDENLHTAIVSHSSPVLTYSEARSDKDRSPTEKQRALGPGTGNASPQNGQWFHEGLAGPMLNSGVCKEVFQFDISPMANPEGIIPALIANSSTDSQYNATHIKQRRYRRALNNLPIPDNNSTTNDTEEYLGKESQRDLLRVNKTPSSMVVSILADPRDVGDLDNMIEPRTFSRIFVVVLLDSVKYVTYSCMLPVRGLSS